MRLTDGGSLRPLCFVLFCFVIAKRGFDKTVVLLLPWWSRGTGEGGGGRGSSCRASDFGGREGGRERGHGVGRAIYE